MFNKNPYNLLIKVRVSQKLKYINTQCFAW